ncbi:transient receptor potential cation channel subfamily M member 2-like isoform X1 [Brachionus plicatilis]|uniref:Transient receptor potential cation channel subfamily M member 2-like isoform X1 n=1 Tax=Brachionus plicatilis TaxID=10195 RepID=A0A3M7RFP6_BRAPC|nr:transient receptor potential cation channel subfamily M member 2-like isoform X1 [Brachionus plicatilis]
MNQKSVLSHIDSIDFTDTDELIESFNLKKTRCDCFVYKLSKDGTDLCFCGLPLHLHHESVRRAFTHKAENYPVEWNYERHTTADEPTDAFGELKFEDFKRNDPKYLRVDFRTPLDQMVKIIFEVWKMHRPKLIISITGGAKNFKINAGIKNALKRAVISAALSTDAWLVTGGTNEGIMKIIGEAFKESAIRLKNRRKLILLGIANWTTIKNNHLLTRKSTKPNMYSHDEEHFKNHPLKEFLDMQKGAYLDPNHTHFILVDNAHLNNYGGELKFQAELLDLITDPKSINVNEIPMVMLLYHQHVLGSGHFFSDIRGSESAKLQLFLKSLFFKSFAKNKKGIVNFKYKLNKNSSFFNNVMPLGGFFPDNETDK